MIRSRVAGEKPVVRQRRIPASRRAARQASAPWMAQTSPRSTAWSKASSKAALACSARCLSPPSSSVKTVILDWPMVRRM